MEEKEQTKKRFRLFDTQRVGRGVEKGEVYRTPGLRGFFRAYKDSFGKLLSVNLLTVFGNFPLLFLIFILTGVTQIDYYAPMSDMFPGLYGVFLIDGTATPATMSLYGIEGIFVLANTSTVWTWICLGIACLAVFTFGCVNAGCAYILRNLVTGDPVFVWTDFVSVIRQNKKQAFFYGIFDAILMVLIPYNLYYYITSGNIGFLNSFLFWMTVVVEILYLFMRRYIYLQMVTFDLPIKKQIKNAFIMAFVGIKRNILALLGSACLLILELLCLFSFGGALLSVGVILPLIALFSHMDFMFTFAAYYKIKELMIDPYLREHPTPAENA